MSLKDEIEKGMKVSVCLLGIACILGGSMLTTKQYVQKNNAKIVMGETGLPKWPITYICDTNGDGKPDREDTYVLGLGQYPYMISKPLQ